MRVWFLRKWCQIVETWTWNTLLFLYRNFACSTQGNWKILLALSLHLLLIENKEKSLVDMNWEYINLATFMCSLSLEAFLSWEVRFPYSDTVPPPPKKKRKLFVSSPRLSYITPYHTHSQTPNSYCKPVQTSSEASLRSKIRQPCDKVTNRETWQSN